MNIICDKALLSAAIDGVSRAVTLRSSIPQLEGILLQADGFQLTLTGYDMEMAIITTIEANVREAGEIVLNAKLLGDMVRRLPGGEITISTDTTGNATVKGGVAEFDINAMSAGDYPPLPNPGADHTLTMPCSQLKEIIDRTIYAVSQDDKRPAHTGELFMIQPQQLTVVALDGFRLAIVQRQVQAQKEIRIVIPGKTLLEVNKLLPDDPDEQVQISANRRFVVFAARGYTIMSRLLEGEFLNYETVMPHGCRTRVEVDTRAFCETIERASLIITERLKNPLRIQIDDHLTVRCQTALGKVVDEMEAKVEGEPVEIGFNNRYLLDALRAAETDEVFMEFNGAFAPMVIRPVEGDTFLFMVMPVRLKNEI